MERTEKGSESGIYRKYCMLSVDFILEQGRNKFIDVTDTQDEVFKY